MQIEDCSVNEDTADYWLNIALTLISVYDRTPNMCFLELADFLLLKLEGYCHEILIQLNRMQIRRRKGSFDETDIASLQQLESKNDAIMFGKYVLLGNKRKAKETFEKLDSETQEAYMNYPIYKLYSEL